MVVGDIAGDASGTCASTACARRSDRRPGACGPRRRGGYRLHLGHDGRPQGRRAHASHPGLRGAPAGRPPGHARSAEPRRCPGGHAIGMLGGLLCPLYSGRPIYMIDGWDPPTVLDAMVESTLPPGAAQRISSRASSIVPASAPSTWSSRGSSRSGARPFPNAVAERADAVGISLVRSYGSTEHPSITGSQHDAPKDKRIHTDGRPMDWVEIRTVDEDWPRRRGGPARRDPERGPDRFAGYTDLAADEGRQSTPTGGSAPATSA